MYYIVYDLGDGHILRSHPTTWHNALEMRERLQGSIGHVTIWNNDTKEIVSNQNDVLGKAVEEVDSWPAWKHGVLEDSSRSTNPKPR